MQTEITRKGKTHVTVTRPWGLYLRNGHRMLCADGVIRAVSSAATPDTFFSVPASIRIKGKTYSGYWSTADTQWTKTRHDNFHTVYVFHPHTGQGCPLPEWPDGDAKNALIDSAF